MDTAAAAVRLGTDTRTLRRFLRSKKSTFEAVGSQGRYEFTEAQLGTLEKRFKAWCNGKGTKPTSKGDIPSQPTPEEAAGARARANQHTNEDEFGDVIIFENIRDPRVLAKVRAETARQEAHLEELLLRAGLHVSQRR